MQSIFRILSAVTGIYSVLIIIRIILSWFGSFSGSKPVDLIARVTDPYLDWWKNKLNIRLGFLDFSALAGIVFLSILQNVFFRLSISMQITIGFILSLCLMAAWNILSFLLGFCLIALILRLIGYATNRNIYGPFWSVVDSVSQPVLYRVNRIIFGKQIVGYLKGILVSIAALAALLFGGGFLIRLLASILLSLPF
jgi:YggT family protein